MAARGGEAACSSQTTERVAFVTTRRLQSTFTRRRKQFRKYFRRSCEKRARAGGAICGRRKNARTICRQKDDKLSRCRDPAIVPTRRMHSRYRAAFALLRSTENSDDVRIKAFSDWGEKLAANRTTGISALLRDKKRRRPRLRFLQTQLRSAADTSRPLATELTNRRPSDP